MPRKAGSVVRTFLAFFAIKIAVEMLGAFAQNSYLDLHALEAATAMALLAASGIYISRRVIRDGDNIAATAGIIAVFIATLWGVYDLEKRREADATHQR
jgi:hypothetical protein